MQRISSLDTKRILRSSARGLAYILSANLSSPCRCVKPDLPAGETDNLPSCQESILRLRLVFIYMGSLPPSRKIYASPGPEGPELREKK